MSKFLRKRWKLNRLMKIPYLILLLVALILVATWLISDNINRSSDSANLIKEMWFSEDPDHTLTMDAILDHDAQFNSNHNFIRMKDPTLSIGPSESYWWIRFTTSMIDGANGPVYLTLNNPTVEEVVVYIPVSNEGTLRYEKRQVGWGVQGEKESRHFMYPVIVIPDEVQTGAPYYIRIYSSYTQNYTFSMYQPEEFWAFHQNGILSVGIFSGIMIAMILINIIHWLILKDRIFLCYVVYMFIMLIYQGTLLGTVYLGMGPWADWLMENITQLGILVMIAAIGFTKAFFNLHEQDSVENRMMNDFMLLSLLNMAALVSPLKHIASLVSLFGGIVGIIMVVRVAIRSVRKDYPQARYFFYGWVFMLASYLIFLARVLGWIPDHLLTRGIMLMAVCLESVLMSAGLSDRFRMLRLEREVAQRRVETAEYEVLTKETAYLQAQIKPHFLYNALNVIATLCRLQPEKARELVLDLSSFMHHSFDLKNINNLIAFEEELEFVNAYVKIEQARFKDQIEIRYELMDIKSLVVPPLILQPLVENAIRHGLRKKNGRGIVVLRAIRKNDHILIEVEDNGIGISEERIKEILDHRIKSDEEEGIGLINIQKRLQLRFGTSLEIISRLGQGTKVSYTLPVDNSFFRCTTTSI